MASPLTREKREGSDPLSGLLADPAPAQSAVGPPPPAPRPVVLSTPAASGPSLPPNKPGRSSAADLRAMSVVSSPSPSPSPSPPLVRPKQKTLEEQVSDFLQGKAPTSPPKPPSLAELERDLQQRASLARQKEGAEAEERAVVSFLRDLARSRRWECVVSLAGKRRLSTGGGSAAPRSASWTSLKVLRASALLQLGKAEEALAEVEGLGFEGSGAGGGPPPPPQHTPPPLSMQAWLLRALLPHHCGDTLLSLDRLYELMGVLAVRAARVSERPVPQEEELGGAMPADMALDAVRSWRWRVAVSIVGVLHASDDCEAALVLCRDLLGFDDADDERRFDVWCAVTKVRVQLGDVEGAGAAVAQLEALAAPTVVEEQSSCQEFAPRVQRLRLLRSMVAFARGEYAEALEELETLLGAIASGECDDRACASEDDDEELADLVGVLGSVPLSVSASNNLALCALHCCDLPRAVRTLEEIVRSDPARNMHAVLIFNLCTLYDLACTADGSKRAKHVLRALGERYGAGLNDRDLRI